MDTTIELPAMRRSAVLAPNTADARRSVPAPLHRSVSATLAGAFANGSAPGTNLFQRRANDHGLVKGKAFDRSGPDAKGPSTVMSDDSADIAVSRDEYAVDQIDGGVFKPVHLVGIPGRITCWPTAPRVRRRKAS